MKYRKEIHDAIYDSLLDLELKFFSVVIESMTRKQVDSAEIQKLREDFEAYIRVHNEVYAEAGGNFTQKLVVERIPNNSWLIWHKEFAEVLKNAPVPCSDSDLRDSLEERVRRRKSGQHIN